MNNIKRALGAFVAVAITLALHIPALAAVEDTGFSDVAANAWYAEAVMYCREHGLMNGTTATTFAPEESLTRAMLVTILYRSAGSPAVTGGNSFSGTVEGAYYADAVVWASQQGLVNGYGGGRFGTNDPVTRQQMAVIFWRYAGSPEVAGEGGFSDAASAAPYAAPAVAWASASGIVRPVSGNVFAPGQEATRAQAASALMNYSQSQSASQPSAPVNSNRTLVHARLINRQVAQITMLDRAITIPQWQYFRCDFEFAKRNQPLIFMQNYIYETGVYPGCLLLPRR